MCRRYRGIGCATLVWLIPDSRSVLTMLFMGCMVSDLPVGKCWQKKKNIQYWRKSLAKENSLAIKDFTNLSMIFTRNSFILTSNPICRLYMFTFQCRNMNSYLAAICIEKAMNICSHIFMGYVRRVHLVLELLYDDWIWRFRIFSRVPHNSFMVIIKYIFMMNLFWRQKPAPRRRKFKT